MNSISAFTAIVTGRVQLVMYRDFVQRTATKLGVTGTVQNLPDNTVRVVAEGEKEKLETLIAQLKRGSFLSRVDTVQVAWTQPSGVYPSFTIQYS